MCTMWYKVVALWWEEAERAPCGLHPCMPYLQSSTIPTCMYNPDNPLLPHILEYGGVKHFLNREVDRPCDYSFQHKAILLKFFTLCNASLHHCNWSRSL